MALYKWKRKVLVKVKDGKEYYSLSLPPQWVRDRVDPETREVTIALLEDGSLLIEPSK